MLLRGRHIEYDVANNGRNAVDIIQTQGDLYDFIFMDFTMPIMVRRDLHLPYLFFSPLFICLTVCLFVCLFVCSSSCFSVCLSFVCLFVYLSVCVSEYAFPFLAFFYSVHVTFLLSFHELLITDFLVTTTLPSELPLSINFDNIT